jgi:DNA-directed RNA polymerase subunit RPC12/RpoP
MSDSFDGDPDDWVVCPDCGSTDATLTMFPEDNDGDLHCPDCDLRLWEVPWAASPGGDES